MERFLDSAVMAKLDTVTIIHGKGTGALRKAVHAAAASRQPKASRASAWAATARGRPVSPWWS